MKTSELKAAGLLPLTEEEERNINGGFVQILIGAAFVIAGAVIRDWDNFKAGLAGNAER